MAALATNLFTQYTLTEQEELSGKIFSQLNLWVLQNMAAEIALQLIYLPVDTVNVLAYAQTEAEMKGQLLLLQQLIESSKEAEITIHMLAIAGNQP